MEARPWLDYAIDNNQDEIDKLAERFLKEVTEELTK